MYLFPKPKLENVSNFSIMFVKTAITGKENGVQQLLRGATISCKAKCESLKKSAERLRYFRCYEGSFENDEDVDGIYSSGTDVECERGSPIH